MAPVEAHTPAVALTRPGAAVVPDTALVPAGAFIMGDDAGRPDERPAHRVIVSPFRMALTPVTNAEYRVFLEATGHEQPRFWSDPMFNADDQPVAGANWL